MITGPMRMNSKAIPMTWMLQSLDLLERTWMDLDAFDAAILRELAARVAVVPIQGEILLE